MMSKILDLIFGCVYICLPFLDLTFGAPADFMAFSPLFKKFRSLILKTLHKSTGNFGCENATEQSIFKMADLSRKDEMLQRARNLAPEQRLPFNEIIGYAKELRKYINGGGQKPKAPLIIVHGGAGSGRTIVG